jgi:putative transposase
MNKAYKFRIYPNESQKILINKTIGSVRFIYNKMLSDKIDFYKEKRESLNNTPAQYKKEFEWLKEVDSLALANAQLNLNKAYKNFFRDKSVGFPKFKSKHKSSKSYTTNNQKGTINLSENNKIINLPKLKGLKIICHRTIKKCEVIKSATISLTSSGKYYISILVEYEKEVEKVSPNKDKAIGIDFSMKDLLVDSEGKKANYPYFYYKYQDKLAKEQIKLSRKIKGSSNYVKQKIRVAKVHELIANSRKDFLHKLSKEYSEKYNIVCLEDINLRNMSQCLNFGKKTNDNGFGMFREFLKYKIEENGGYFIKIDRWFPSSKMCRHCGVINSNLKLGEMEWVCECGETIDRDLNASINIKNEGFRILTVGTTGLA